MLVQEVKLYPTPLQAQWLDCCFRLCSRVWNWGLERQKTVYSETGKGLNYSQQTAELTQLRQADYELASYLYNFQREMLNRLHKAFTAFFRRVKSGNKPGFPRFKSEQLLSSITCSQAANYLRDRRCHIPGLGLISCRWSHRLLIGKQKSITVIRRASGWYAQILFDSTKPAPDKVKCGKAVGIDLGLKTLSVLSDGTHVKNPRWLKSIAVKLKRLHQQLSSKQKGSWGRHKARKALARMYERLSNLRRNFAHHLSKQWVQQYDLIGFEDLSIQVLVRNKEIKLAKSILDACWSLLIQLTTYKAANAGKWCLKILAAGTTQECSRCHRIVPKTLRDRVHDCPCGLVCDRDDNASQNILQRTIRAVGPDFKPTNVRVGRKLARTS